MRAARELLRVARCNYELLGDSGSSASSAAPRRRQRPLGLVMGCGASKEGGGGDKYELEMIGSHPQNVLPAFCAANAHLRKVNVSSCELRVLPAAINFLVALEELDCSQNKLEALPNEIGDCVNLKTLDCNDNQLATLPDTLGKCKNLAQLIAYKNALGALPAALGELKELNELNCFNNKLLKLPPTLGGMAGLEEVNLAANKVMQLPKESVAEWTGVKVFNVYDCRLVRLAPLAHMVQLTELRLFGNNLEDMPDCGGGLPALRLLELHRNRIAAIPAGFFSKMTSLRRLTISSNKLAAVPADDWRVPARVAPARRQRAHVDPLRGRDDPDADGALRPGEPDHRAPRLSCRTPRSSASTSRRTRSSAAKATSST